jgi:signal transduction histidine kinase
LADDLRRASQHVREIAYDLRPPVLDDLGLAAAILDRVARGQEPGAVNVVVDAPDNGLCGRVGLGRPAWRCGRQPT